MTSPQTTISTIITIDDKHVFSGTEKHLLISKYFETQHFADYATNAEVDSDLMIKISEGLTTYIRDMYTGDQSVFEFGDEVVAMCTNTKVAGDDATGNVKAVFVIGISSNVEV